MHPTPPDPQIQGIDWVRATAVAEELAQRRSSLRPGRAREKRIALGETAALATFGREVRERDLHRQGTNLQLRPVDDAGHTVRVVTGDFLPMRVYANLLETEVFLFVSTPVVGHPDVLGWAPRWRVEEAPVDFWEKDGKRQTYFHEMERASFSELPEEFKFIDTCTHCDVPPVHEGTNAATWNLTVGAWECFGCEVLIYDSRAKERVAEIDDSFRAEILAKQTGANSTRTEFTGGPES